MKKQTPQIETVSVDELIDGPDEKQLPQGQENEVEKGLSAVFKRTAGNTRNLFKQVWKVAVIFLGLEVLVYILDFFGLYAIADTYLPAGIFAAELIVFVGLAVKSSSEGKIKKSFSVPIFLGFVIGLSSAIVRVFWHLESWTFYNLFFEPLILMAWSLMVSIVINLVWIAIKKINKIIQYKKLKVKKDLNI